MYKMIKYKIWKLPDKEAEEIQPNKICVDLIGIYILQGKGQKENPHIKSSYYDRLSNRMVCGKEL